MLSRHAKTALALLAGCQSISFTATAAGYKFKTVDYGSQTTVLHGINTAKVIAGDWTDANDIAYCFTVTGKKQVLLTDPKGTATFCANINNNGVIAGYYMTATTDVGFTYQNGTFTDVPGPAGSVYSQVYGVSDKGVIVGAWVDAADNEHGFLLKGTKYTTFDAPGAADTIGVGIDDAGDYVAQAFDGQGQPTAFLFSGNKTLQLIFPGGTATRAHAINNKGQVALAWVDASGVKHGGVYDSKKATYTQVDVPGASYTAVMGISDKESLVGNFIAASGQQQGFVATGKLP